MEIAVKRAQFRELLLKKDLVLKGVIEDDGFPTQLGLNLKPAMPQVRTPPQKLLHPSNPPLYLRRRKAGSS